MLRKRFIALLILLLIIAIATFAYLRIQAGNAANPAVPFAAIVNVIKGSPKMQLPGSQFLLDVKSGDKVTAGTLIRTDKKSQALVIFANNAVLTVAENSEIKVKEIQQSDGTYQTKIEHTAGKIFSQIENVIGTENDYKVQSGEIIAAVRGTGFGSSIDSAGKITFYVTEHKVDLQNTRNILIRTLQEGESIYLDPTQQDLSENAETFTAQEFKLGDNAWDKLIACITKNAKAKTEGEEKDLISHANELTTCKPESTSPKPTPKPQPSPTPTPSETPTTVKYPVPKITSISIGYLNTRTPGFRCSWKDENASSFRTSIGTTPGGSGMTGWKTTSSNSRDFTGLNLVSGRTYYCNVQGYGQNNQVTSVKTSKGYFFDNSYASFLSVDPDSNQTFYYGLIASGTARYGRVSLGNLAVKYYIRSLGPKNKGLYLNNSGGWQTALSWHGTDKSDEGTGIFDFMGRRDFAASIPDSEVVEVYYVLYNTAWSRTYQQYKATNIKKEYILY